MLPRRTSLLFAILFASAIACFAQTATQSPDPTTTPAPTLAEPLIVDAHMSPYRATVIYRTNLGHNRFEMRDATIVDLIAFAYNREYAAILTGPTWIDFDRFDIVASVPSVKPPSLNPGPPDATGLLPNPYDPVRPILKRTLEERFHLKYHTEQRPLPGYAMTLARDGAKLAEAKDPSASPECHSAQDKAIPGQRTLACTSETITQLLAMFGGVYPHPVIDRTGLAKSYDFTLKFVFGNLRTRDDLIHLYTDAFSKQLGLVVTPGDVPQPAIVVDSVDRPKPTPLAVAELLPPRPELEFEVATVKPSAPEEPHAVRSSGSQITFSSFALRDLLGRAFQLTTGFTLSNTPPWLSQTKYTILVKLPPDVDASAEWQDQDLIANMLQKLLVDRFQIKYHWGTQTQDGYVLLAGTPKMKKADPNSRSFCKNGPPPGEKDARSAPDSPFDIEFHCQNVTMDQFADMVQAVAGVDVKNRVANKTGLPGSYDFTLYFTSEGKLSNAGQASASEAGDTSATPAGGLSVVDAFRKELGLRLEKQPGTYPALVIDHIEEKPTEN